MTRATTDDGPHRSGRARGRRPLAGAATVLALVAVLTAACGGAGVATSTTEAPRPAGPTPSAIARQVCQHEAQADIASALGVSATVSTPTWADHLYSCTYRYPRASMGLSVKELSSWAETLAYFNRLGVEMGRTRTIANIGQGAFQTTNGSMVVRKDWKVLVVDVASLPAQFGVPPTSSGDVAVTVADVILGCWAGD